MRPVVGQQQKVDGILKTLSAELEQGKYAEATKLLRDVDVRGIEMPRDKNRGEFKYLAVKGFGAFVPGIPKWRAVSALTERRVTYLTGTTDYSKNATEAEFQDAAAEFAANYNMFARHFGTEVVEKEGEVELSTVRKELSLTSEEWEHIPLHAQLKIRNLIEQLLETESDKQGKRQGLR